MIGDGELDQGTNAYTLMLDLQGDNPQKWVWENPDNGLARAQRFEAGDHAAGEFHNGEWYIFSGLVNDNS